MKFVKVVRNINLTMVVCLFFASGVFAQQTAPTPRQREQVTKLETKPDSVKTAPGEIQKAENTSKQISESPDKKASRTAEETPADDAEQVVGYFNNYLKEYRLGPEDIITVEVFGQPNYSKAGINVPPTAIIAYPLIPGGVHVGGKTTDQVGKEIARRLDEYIIDPQVTVSLEKVGSQRYSVMGDVTNPGIRLMTRRVTALSAVTEAGGVLPTGSKSKAIIYRNTGMGGYSQVPVNLDAIIKGKANDVELQPGDQVFIPGNRMKTFNGILETISKVSAFRLLFGVPF